MGIISFPRLVVVGVLDFFFQKMEVDIWRGDWGLPSIDVQCLQVLVGFSCFPFL